MHEPTVHCGCKRVMQTDTLAGRGHYRCTCGAKVVITGLPRADPKHCGIMIGGHVCNGPKRAYDITCQPCAHKIARNALVDPESREQLAVHFEQGELLRIREQERERQRQEHEARNAEWNRKERVRRVCVVYYCLLRPGVVKIGTTTQLAIRIDSFRVPTSAVLAAEPGYFQLEKLRHQQFATQRIAVAYEDFRLDDALQAHIDKVRTTHGDPYELVTRIYQKQQELAEDPNSELPFGKVG